MGASKHDTQGGALAPDETTASVRGDRMAQSADGLARWLDGANIVRVARLTGIGRSTLYQWIDASHPMPAWAVAPIYSAHPSLSGLSETLGLGDLGLVLSPSSSARAPDTQLPAEALRVGRAVGDVQGEILIAVADGLVTNVERDTIQARVDALKEEAARLESILRAGNVRLVEPSR
jgi:hypothetical protein